MLLLGKFPCYLKRILVYSKNRSRLPLQIDLSHNRHKKDWLFCVFKKFYKSNGSQNALLEFTLLQCILLRCVVFLFRKCLEKESLAPDVAPLLSS